MITFDTPLTRAELARALGVHRHTLLNFQHRGWLEPPTRINGRRVEFTPQAQMVAADLVAGGRQ